MIYDYTIGKKPTTNELQFSSYSSCETFSVGSQFSEIIHIASVRFCNTTEILVFPWDYLLFPREIVFPYGFFNKPRELSISLGIFTLLQKR